MPIRIPLHAPIAALVVAIGVLMSLGGCSSARLDQLAEQVRKTQTEIAAQLAELPPQGEGTPTQAQTRELLDQAARVADQTLAAIEDAKGRGVIATIADAVIPFVPEPWRELVLMAGGIGGVLETLRRKSRGLRTLAQSTVAMATTDTGASSVIASHAPMLRRVQSPEARRAIDRAQRAAVLAGAGG